jgi:hypothetical protein
MTSPGVTWTFLGVPRAIALVGDSCTMWARRIEKPGSLEVARLEGSKRESSRTEVPEVRSPKL